MSDADRHPRRWTLAEDQTLREHVDAQQAQGGGRDWCQIALALPGRTNKDCRKRWHNSVAEGLKKGQWSKSEDQLLTHGVHCYGSQWTKVATCVSSRSADQCAKRWQQSLDPRLDRSEWREHEDMALLAAVDRLGRHWKDIQEHYLPHRSKNCVKNRYSVLARRFAARMVPYAESLGSSSSDPGTPLQLRCELPPRPTPMPPAQDFTQALYTQSQMPYVSDDGLWTDTSNLSVVLSHCQPFNTNPWPGYSGVHQSQVLAGSQSHWNAEPVSSGMQQYPLRYSTLSTSSMPGCTYQTQQCPQTSSVIPYATLATQPFGFNAPAARLPSSPAFRPDHGEQYRNDAPLG